MHRKEMIRKQKLRYDGYYEVGLHKDGGVWHQAVHRLVAGVFCVKPKGCTIVNHINNCRTDNRASNLEWTTYKGNYQHSADQHRNCFGEQHGMHIHNLEVVYKCYALYKGGYSTREIADMLDIERPWVWGVVTGRTWKVTYNEDYENIKPVEKKQQESIAMG